MPRTAPSTSWLTDNEEQPRSGTLSGNRFRRRARFYRVYLLASAALAPLLLLALVAAVTTSPGTPTAPPPVQVSPGRAAATEALLDWLSPPNPGLAAGRLLLWSGARAITPPVTENTATSGDVDVSVEVDTFVVVDGAGNRFTAEFQVAVDGQGRARVLSGPSLAPLPVLDPDATRSAGPWPGRPSSPAAEPVAAAVRAWATAYTSGDPAALRLTVGDPDRTRTYLPLTGVATAATAVEACTSLDPGTVVARVELTVTWSASTPASTATAAPAPDPPAPPPVTFDVLVTGADTGAPRVVAWGGPGTGPALTPFGNAVAADTAPAAAVPTTAPPAPLATWVPPTTSHGPAG